MAVRAETHAGQACHFFSLAAGRDDNHFVVRDLLHTGAALSNEPAGRLDVAEVLRDFDVRFHAASGQEDLAIRVLGNIDDHLDAVEQGREGRDDHAPFGVHDKILNRSRNFAFAFRVARLCGIRRICNDGEHTLLS